jgi:7-cyano-7-deazaguanine synthase
VAAGVAARDTRIALLHIKDHRATAKQAADAFAKQVAHFKPLKSWIIDGAYLREMQLPVESAGVIHSTSSDALAALLPMRELQLLTLAAGFARQIRCGSIVWGAQIDTKQADLMGKMIELTQVMNQVLSLLSFDSPITIRTPLMGLEDTQVIELGYQMGLPFAASWTCQNALESPCMSCPACVRRTRAFRGAQLVDPLSAKKSVVKA